MNGTLTVLCVTDYGPHAGPFLDEHQALAESLSAAYVEFDGRTAGIIESVLDEAVTTCQDGYILRLDDDERPTPEMIAWLAAGSYIEHDHWCFPRLNLYPDAEHYICNPGLWPDLQTRLSVKAKSGGRSTVHVGSPFGSGEVAPCGIEHHKFLVRSLEERRALVERYESISPGAGTNFRAFSVPEDIEGVATDLVADAFVAAAA